MFDIRKIYKKEGFLLIARLMQISILLTVLILAFFVLERDLVAHMDFTSYYTSASILKNKMGNLFYDIPTQLSFQKSYFDTNSIAVPYKNLPLLAVLFIPFSYFPLTVSYKLFVLVNITLLVVSAKLLSRHFSSFDERFVHLLVFLFFPALIAILMGQVSLLTLILWIFIFQALKSKKAFLLGVLTALLLNKLQFLVFFPFAFILTKDKRKFLFSFSLVTLAILAISEVIVGWQGLVDYPQFLIETESARYGSEVLSQTTVSSAIHYLAYIFKIDFLNSVAVYAVNFLIFLIPIVLFVKNYRKMPLEGSFSIATFLTLAFMPHGWEYTLVITLVPVFCLLAAIHKGKNERINRIRILLVLFIFLLWTFRFWAAPFWTGISLAVLGSTLLIYAKRLPLFKI
jgi:hypothetical protein